MPHITALRSLARAALAAWLVTLVPSWSAIGGEDAGPARGPLDGMSFVGALGPEGEPGDREDIIHFADGQFWSENCVPCGFPPGPYWVRFEDDGIHFRGELSSPGSGEFSYTGVVQDNQLTVTMNWRKDRWYWSIDRNFWFEGTLKATVAAEPAPGPASIAVAAATEPRVCEP